MRRVQAELSRLLRGVPETRAMRAGGIALDRTPSARLRCPSSVGSAFATAPDNMLQDLFVKQYSLISR